MPHLSGDVQHAAGVERQSGEGAEVAGQVDDADAEVGRQVPDAQGAPADAEQALPLHAQLLHRAAVPRQRAYAPALLQVPHLRTPAFMSMQKSKNLKLMKISGGERAAERVLVRTCLQSVPTLTGVAEKHFSTAEAAQLIP